MDRCPTQKRLKELFIYDKLTGLFTRKIDVYKYKKGSIAGSKKVDGYIAIKIDGVSYFAHRLAWLYVKGYWPKYDVHHKDGDKSNNKWDNLEHLSLSKHRLTRGIQKNNTSGVIGVCFYKRNKKWISHITINNNQKILGQFSNKIDAVKSRRNAEIFYNFDKYRDSTAKKYLEKHLINY